MIIMVRLVSHNSKGGLAFHESIGCLIWKKHFGLCKSTGCLILQEPLGNIVLLSFLVCLCVVREHACFLFNLFNYLPFSL